MKTSEVLQVARYLLHDPSWWWPGNQNPNKPYANCSATAVIEVRHQFGGTHENVNNSFDLLQKVMQPKRSIADWNDSHTHSEVLQKFDQAIAIAQAEEANA